MSDPVLEFDTAAKRFGARHVLSGLSLTVPRGCILGLLGKNGAGKTTLIKCALGLLRLDSGSARILGEAPWDLSGAAKARLGYVPQTPCLHGFLTVRQMLSHLGSFYPSWNEALIERLLGEWELEGGAKCGKLSIGQQQKLSILLALGHEPDLLVLDEPAASLDPAARRHFLQALVEVALSGGRTVLFSTHITSDLERVADRVAILAQGRIAYSGELDRLKDEVKRLRIVSTRALPGDFAVPGMLSHEVEGRVARVAVRNASSELVAQLQRDWDATVDLQDLNLEDIFLELHHAQ